MLIRWSLLFFVLAFCAAVIGFSGIAGDALGIGKAFFFVFMVAFIITFVVGRSWRAQPPA